MKQMSVDESLIVHIDYEDPALSSAVRQFKPVLYKEDELFCCILGPDREQGIYACGSTEDGAIRNWEDAFRERVKSKNDDDEIVLYIKDTLTTLKKDVW